MVAAVGIRTRPGWDSLGGRGMLSGALFGWVGSRTVRRCAVSIGWRVTQQLKGSTVSTASPGANARGIERWDCGHCDAISGGGDPGRRSVERQAVVMATGIVSGGSPCAALWGPARACAGDSVAGSSGGLADATSPRRGSLAWPWGQRALRGLPASCRTDGSGRQAVRAGHRSSPRTPRA